jgi:nicotinamidase-related amidase
MFVLARNIRTPYWKPMTLAQQSKPFVNHLEGWLGALPALSVKKAIPDPATTAVLCVDIINGFCTIGPLSSPRVQAIVAPITKLFKAAHKRGVRHFILTQDTHPADAVEFSHYPPHCVRGTAESQTAPELDKLSFSDLFTRFEKNSISSSHNTPLDRWLKAHPELDTFIVVGDCSDLCTYQMAMHLRLRANARQQRGVRVIVPADCVQTYDTPVVVARKLGIPPHDGDLLHAVFLHNMANNGVEVVGTIQ